LGIDDRLVVVSSQGDVVIYQGTDPDDSTKFSKVGTWYVGPLPAGRRQVTAFGGDVHILSQFGVVPVSKLQSTASVPSDQQQHISYLVDPLLARIMQDYSASQPWQVLDASREELILIGIPMDVVDWGGMFFAYKFTTQTWSIVSDTRYAYVCPVSNLLFAGTTDGRVVKAFNGSLDNVQIGATFGDPILCQVTPSFQPLGDPGVVKVFTMVRPTFLTTAVPSLRVAMMVDYGIPSVTYAPALPGFASARWDAAIWDADRWSGYLSPLNKWIGCEGTGFTATVQLDYLCGGDTLLMSIDYWDESGGIM
jgi:hypothetical protein